MQQSVMLSFIVVCQVGKGKVGYDKAVKAVRCWKHMDLGWTTVHADPVVKGGLVCVLPHVLFAWMKLPLKVAYVEQGKSSASWTGIHHVLHDLHTDVNMRSDVCHSLTVVWCKCMGTLDTMSHMTFWANCIHVCIHEFACRDKYVHCKLTRTILLIHTPCRPAPEVCA